MTKDFSQADNLTAKGAREAQGTPGGAFDEEARSTTCTRSMTALADGTTGASWPFPGSGRKSVVFYPGAERIAKRAAPPTIGNQLHDHGGLRQLEGRRRRLLVSQGGAIGGLLPVRQGWKDQLRLQQHRRRPHPDRREGDSAPRRRSRPCSSSWRTHRAVASPERSR